MKRSLSLVSIVLALLSPALRPPCASAQATFAQPLNVAVSTLASDHAVGSGTLVVQPGDGKLFGNPSPTDPVRVTVARRSTLVPQTAAGRMVPTSVRTIFLVTARSGDTLSGLSVPADENTLAWSNADAAYTRNDPVQVVTTQGDILQLQETIAGLPLDDTVVHLDVPETITALKTFQAQDPLTKAAIVESATPVTLTVTTAAVSSNVATLTTSSAHGLTVGKAVVVNAIVPTYFNGPFVVTAVPSATTFSYALSHGNVTATSVTGTVAFGEDPLQVVGGDGGMTVGIHGDVTFTRSLPASTQVGYGNPAILVRHVTAGARGNAALAFYDTGMAALGNANIFGIQTVIKDDGGYQTGRELVMSQKRNTDGTIVDVWPGMSGGLSISSDTVGPNLKMENYHSRAGGGGNDRLILMTFDLDDIDTNAEPPTPYSSGSGKGKFSIDSLGRHAWGTDLVLSTGITDSWARGKAWLYYNSDRDKLTAEGVFTTVTRLDAQASGVIARPLDLLSTQAQAAGNSVRLRFFTPTNGIPYPDATSPNQYQAGIEAITESVANFTGSLAFMTNSGLTLVERGRIDSAGRWMVNTTTQLGQMTIVPRDTNTAGVVVKLAASQAVPALQVLDSTGATTLWQVLQNGNVRVGQVQINDTTGGNGQILIPAITAFDTSAFLLRNAAGTVTTFRADPGTNTIGFYGASPVARPSTTGQTTGFTAGAGAAVDSAATFTGGAGTAYTVGDLVKHLKALGLIAQFVVVPFGVGRLRRYRRAA